EQIATASGDGTARVWDARSGGPSLELSHSNWVPNVAFSPDSALVCTVVAGAARTWDARNGRLRSLLRLDGAGTPVAFSPDGAWVATQSADVDGRILLWDFRTGSLLRELKGHSDRVFALTFSADGTRIASAAFDGTIRLWGASTGAPLRTFDA